MRTSIRTLASHAPRVPSIKFPSRNRLTNGTHTPTAHPAAPQAVIDAFPSFLKKLSASTKFNATSPSPPAVGTSKASFATVTELQSEYEMPRRLQRGRYAPSMDEIEAVESGGASIAPVVTKASRKSWYTSQF